MKNIKVSIIIPIYNVEKYLEECLDSLLLQTLSQIEIICVDDGSTDRTKELLNVYEKRDQRIKVLNQENLYAGVARNNGLKIAQGKYVLFLDSDDFFEQTMLEELYEEAEKYQSDICICDGRIYHHDKNNFSKPKHYLKTAFLPKKQPFSYQDIPDHIFNITSPAPWNMLYLKNFILDNNLEFQDCQRANDLRFYGMAIVKAKKIVTIKNRLVNYRKGIPNNLQSHNDKTPLVAFGALEQIKLELENMGIYKIVEKSFLNFTMHTIIYNLNQLKTTEGFTSLYEKVFAKENCLIHFDDFPKSDFYLEDIYEKYQYYRDTSLETLLLKFEDHRQTSKFNVVQDKREYGENGCKVSVIVPVYNTERFLKECLESVIEQSLKDIELICINDGSTDNSMKVLETYAEKEPRIILIDKSNGGLSNTRNVGIQYAKGEYILFLDSDDLLESDALEVLYKRAKGTLDVVLFNAGLAFDHEILNEAEIELSKYYQRKHSYYFDMPGKDLLEKMVRVKEYRESACLQLLRREFLKKNNLDFYEGILHEDNLFTFKVLLLSKLAGYSDRELYIRRIRSGSIMTSVYTEENFRGYFISYTEMLLFANSLSNINDINAYITRAIDRVYSGCIRIYEDLSKEEKSRIQFNDNITAKRLYVRFKRYMNVKAKLEKVRDSKSFIVGKGITWLPRRLKKLISVPKST